MLRGREHWSGRKLHFVGIGGAGMSGLALVARQLGASVSGSDREDSSYTEKLRAAGIEPVIGHAAENVPDGAELVYSTAIADDNPELLRAKELGLNTIHRGELLGELTELKRCIAVAGTHGKTTTTSMIAHILIECGADPAYVIGGELRTTGQNAGWASGEWLVVEADESDRSLLHLKPEIAVLTNAELDHHTTFNSRLDLEQTLREFLAKADRAVIWDRPQLLALAKGKVVPFDAVEGVELQLPGLHNARNAAAAIQAATLTGIDRERAAAALKSFRGAGRRFEYVGETASGAAIYDDYAHHPTEVAATLAAARTLDPRRVVAVFQPHLYSRTAVLTSEFGSALAAADLVVVLEIYAARERSEDYPGVSGLTVAEATAEAGGGRTVCWLPTLDQAERYLRDELRSGDLCLLLGAGDINTLSQRLVK